MPALETATDRPHRQSAGMSFVAWLRFRRDVSWWLMHRWPRNPFLFFVDLALLLVDLAVLPFFSPKRRYAAVFDQAFRLDCLRERGQLPPADQRAIAALRRVIIFTYEDLRTPSDTPGR